MILVDETPVNFSKVIDTSRLCAFHLRIVGLCASLIFFDGFDLQAVSYTAPALAGALGITRPMLGPVFSASVLGVALGALLFGVLGDRLGRKANFIVCGLIFGAASLATAHAATLTTLLVWRVVAGLGLGGATPIAIAITTDYCPRRVRTALVVIMYSSFAVGAIAGGATVAGVHVWGWRSVYYIGGTVPILLSPVLALALPESLDYLLRRGDRAADVCRILSKLGPRIPENEIRKLKAGRDPERGFEVSRLFRNGRALRTLLLWAIFFMNLIALYFYNTWLPTLLSDAGISASSIVEITAAGQIGGLAGALVIARLLVSQPPFAVIASGSLFVAAGFLSMFHAGTSQGALLAGNFFLGLFLLGSQYGLNAMSAQLYPSNIRATAVGWALGVGRLGGILGPSIAGMLIALRWAPWHLFLFAAIPAVLSSAGACGMHRLLREPSMPESNPPG